MMPALQHFGVGCIPWSPLAGGRTFRPYVRRFCFG
jgi:aryl-alcohol dehydrogenase-like predicted oxidoreductase